MAVDQCPACGAVAGPGDVYCEACGHELAAPAGEAPVGAAAQAPGRAGSQVPPRWVSSSAATPACPGCGGDVFGAEGYCEACGQRRPVAGEHSELALPGAAGVSDRGRRTARNEDALGLAVLPAHRVALVCDGVGSSTRADAASHAAVDAALPALVDGLEAGQAAGVAIGAAARAAQAAVTLTAGSQPPANPPSSTFVCAVVERAVVTVGWVGDSRAYWVPAAGAAEQLTVDDAVPGRFPDGQPVPDHAGALTRWLGSDARDTEAHLRSFTPAGPGRILVVSDGLFRYYPEPAQLAAVVPDAEPAAVASALVQLALDAGGADNVTVAVVPWSPPDASTTPPADPAQEQ
jgi:serine/threonine protein phosphatase PrpC